ncbi:acyltransferase family protein [Vibrio rotiferianus]|uniref:acyltransferase family protein n=1 Tax=Vibrio rotiferianus TaxID=190895 RepID=UPI00397FE33E
MGRTPFFDNAKFILVFLVVFGHLIEPLIENSPIIKIVYLSIYSFHMPAFVIISGMLSRSDGSSDVVAKAVRNILIPFIAFTIAYEAFNYLTTGSISNYTKNVQPYWMLWFLYSLFLWKLLLPSILKFKYPIAMTLLIAISAGYIGSIGYDFGVSRTLYFLPFFVIGHKITPDTFMSVRSKYCSRSLKVAMVGFVVLNIALFSYYNGMAHQWLYGSFSYSRLGIGDISAGLIRFGLMLISLLTAFAVLLLTPVGSNKILSQGKNSLYVYAWHGFFIKAFIILGVPMLLTSYSVLTCLFFLFVFSVILTLTLSQEFIANKTKQLVLNPLNHILQSRKIS